MPKNCIHHVYSYIADMWPVISLTRSSHYQAILEALFLNLSQNQPPRVVDNICGAVSRMMMANRNSLPLEKV